MANNIGYVKVHLLDCPYHIDNAYTYYLPATIDSSRIRRGSFVAVPFGNSNRISYAVVTELLGDCELKNTKPVLAVSDERFSLTDEMLGLCLFLKSHTLCSVGDAVRAVTPSAVFSMLCEYYSFRLDGDGLASSGLDGDLRAVLTFAAEQGRLSVTEFVSKFGSGVKRQLQTLTRLGALEKSYELELPSNIKYLRFAHLSVEADEVRAALSATGRSAIRAPGQRAMLDELLAEDDSVEVSELFERTGAGNPQLDALVKRGLVAVTREESLRTPYLKYAAKRDRSEIVLTRAQTAAYEALAEEYKKEKAAAALLFGVTGSGKTKVMMKLIDQVIAEGKGVIVMVPEIALTPQTLGIFCSRYGERVAVIHSSLSAGERFDAWRRIAEGKADLVIGTRSAVFAPIPNLGLIIIDEEHEHTYKSDTNPKYRTVDVASYRAGVHNALVVLASATPSIESMYKAKKGTYRLVELRERYGGARLPDVEIVDMREELRAGNLSPISRRLFDELDENFELERQSVIFLNRRGFNNIVSCRSCGWTATCPRCSLSLTYHADCGGYLLCHCCGHKETPPRACPECGYDNVAFLGFGTQKIESELSIMLPDAKVLRMDADTTASKDSHDRLLGDFRAKDYDILLGTQMVTKGHDFPSVTLVGVLLADMSLHVNDYRASERTFSLLTQVIGRAGRGDFPGRAVIQTYAPDNEVITLACAQDYDRFYEREIKIRRELTFPPFCDMVQFTVTSVYEDELTRAAERLVAETAALAGKEYRDLPLCIFGPFEAQLYKAEEKFRMRMIIKCRLTRRTREFFSRLMIDFSRKVGSKMSISVDINPSST